MDRIVAIIPARMGSSRFPGKPLAPILGRPMIEHVVRRTERCDLLDEIYVATCDEEIRDGFEPPLSPEDLAAAWRHCNPQRGQSQSDLAKQA